MLSRTDRKNSVIQRAASFATTFVFAIVTPVAGGSGGHGFAFTISPTRNRSKASTDVYLGLFSPKDNGNSSNHVFAIEFDTVQSLTLFGDINDNHVGIDINSLRSNSSVSASYYDNTTRSWADLELESGNQIQAWVEYDGVHKIVNVTISPSFQPKPNRPLLSHAIDLSPILQESMYVGFSSSTGKLASSHYILGWSFGMNTEAHPLDLSKVPPTPHHRTRSSELKKRDLEIGVGSSLVTFVFLVGAIITLVFILRRAELADDLDDWELDFPRRFRYKDLHAATRGFKKSQLLGTGGFGSVYKGVLPRTKDEVAVKKISHNSKQGVKEFIAEIASLGNLRHRHLVHLQGWCRKKGDLLLVYDYMSNGSLDAFLYQENKNLDWRQRFRILKEIGAGLTYLHEEWEQVILHRDVKASNVLLDTNMTAKLGDFGLAKLYEHGKNPSTTHVVGTVGYIAPEISFTGKATTSSDVFAFGALLLEVACGRRPLDTSVPSAGQVILQDWVSECHQRGEILRAADPKLGNSYEREEVELVLKLGLLCSDLEPQARPKMRQVTCYLRGSDPLPKLDVPSHVVIESGSLDLITDSYPSSCGVVSTGSLRCGR
ncbi:L-type lectin-domain containing receptor kinase IV.2-like isoform X2 [Malania oleifera]|nr:L-type lectin-domain containing receptor kinase IV.2-like isoform X2 [Malania oleifera]XP_057980752.1 L-type lectin-domain containing receptor kinase IV.2-like isoform X2 [Malania oleifera]